MACSDGPMSDAKSLGPPGVSSGSVGARQFELDSVTRPSIVCACCGEPGRTAVGCSCTGGKSHVCRRTGDPILRAKAANPQSKFTCACCGEPGRNIAGCSCRGGMSHRCRLGQMAPSATPERQKVPLPTLGATEKPTWSTATPSSMATPTATRRPTSLVAANEWKLITQQDSPLERWGRVMKKLMVHLHHAAGSNRDECFFFGRVCSHR